jgi:diketogulonate reductase-like aldo/keto reductase
LFRDPNSHYSQGFIIIPKSVSQKRIVSNANVFDFELAEEDMKEVSYIV